MNSLFHKVIWLAKKLVLDLPKAPVKRRINGVANFLSTYVHLENGNTKPIFILKSRLYSNLHGAENDIIRWRTILLEINTQLFFILAQLFVI